MTLANHSRRLLAIGVTSLALLSSGPSFAASACKGLSNSACDSNTSCNWVESYKRKDGVKVKAHCRSASKKKSALTSSKTKASSEKAKAQDSAKSKADTKKTKTEIKKAESKKAKAEVKKPKADSKKAKTEAKKLKKPTDKKKDKKSSSN